MAKSYFNSKEFSWSDIKVILFGRPVTGIRGITYESDKEKELLYAAGSEPHAVQHGNRSISGTLTLLQSELEALNNSAELAGYDDVLDLDFDIVVMYQAGVNIKTDTIKFSSVTKFNKGMMQNDKFAEVALPFVALGIKTGLV